MAMTISGVVVAPVWPVHEMRHGEFANAFRSYRANLGRGILPIAADIVGTVAIVLSFDRLGVLALIIVIRTLLSFSLQIEIEGRWPSTERRGRGQH